MMEPLTLIVTVLGSASFGAIAGKLIEVFWLSSVIESHERKKWIRNLKIEAYAALSQEMLSLGTKSYVHDDPWEFRSLAAKAIILLENDDLINEINDFIHELYRMNTGTADIKSSLPDDFKAILPDGNIATKKDFEKGFLIGLMEKKALEITKKLAKELRET
jgi:hypothetical protein